MLPPTHQCTVWPELYSAKLWSGCKAAHTRLTLTRYSAKQSVCERLTMTNDWPTVNGLLPLAYCIMHNCLLAFHVSVQALKATYGRVAAQPGFVLDTTSCCLA